MTKQPNTPERSHQSQAGSHGAAPRQQQQYDAGEGGQFVKQIHPRMEVIGADGGHVGKVERVEGSRIRLDPQDWQGSDRGSAHFVPLDQVGGIEDDKVRLTLDAASATSIAATH